MSQSAEKRLVRLDNGDEQPGAFPVVISASRRTDIPAFYADWFFWRLQKGYSGCLNPFNNKKSYISYQDVKFIIFWSKNPAPLLKHLDRLAERNIGCYIHFTLNDYEQEKLEPGAPPLGKRIASFMALSEKLGRHAVIWRYDPLILTDSISMDKLLARIENIGERIHAYTEKMIFSFADILSYRKVKANLQKKHIAYRDWSHEQMREFAETLTALVRKKGWGLRLAACAENLDLPGIERGKCVDDRLMLRIRPDSPEILQYLGLAKDRQPVLPGLESAKEAAKDKGQRPDCLCVKSRDVGAYHTCPHGCEYCYANAGGENALKNYNYFKNNPEQDSLPGPR